MNKLEFKIQYEFKVSKIKVYDFDWIESKKQDYGVMAHELQEILPLAVTGEKDGKGKRDKIA